jgi:hypothetical protein
MTARHGLRYAKHRYQPYGGDRGERARGEFDSGDSQATHTAASSSWTGITGKEVGPEQVANGKATAHRSDRPAVVSKQQGQVARPYNQRRVYNGGAPVSTANR